MSKAKKIAESFLKSLLDQGLYKTYKMSIKELAEMMVESFKDEVQFGTVTESYLHKYTTKQLLDMVNKNVADGGMKDEGRAEVVFNIVNLLYQRQREYMAVTGDTNLKPNPDDVDRILFPPKPPKRRPKALPESEFKRNIIIETQTVGIDVLIAVQCIVCQCVITIGTNSTL